MTMHASEIRKIVTEIRNAKGSNDYKDKHFRAKYPDFVMQLPKLFVAALNDSFPLQYLDLMLQQYDAIQNKTTSVNDADQLVYGKLRAKYVDPLVQTAQAQGQDANMNIINEDGTCTTIPTSEQSAST